MGAANKIVVGRYEGGARLVHDARANLLATLRRAPRVDHLGSIAAHGVDLWYRRVARDDNVRLETAMA